MLPSVRDVLALPVLQAAAPQLLGGSARLDAQVRWVHVSELLDISGLLAGGELVLTTGLELEKHPDLTVGFVASLEQAGAAGLVVELTGNRERSMAALHAAARRTSLPIAVVQRRVRFVQVTEVVHRMIVAEQLERVERARDVHEAFTLLSLENAGTQLVVEKAAELIGAPVILEDLAHLVLAFSAHGRSAAELLADWERRSRTTPSTAGTSRAGAEAWLQTPVGVQRQLWGRLVVPMEMDDDGPAAMVLERAAQALAINRLAERDRRELSQQAQAGLLNALRQPRGLDEAEALARAAALGLKRSPFYVPVVFRRTGHTAAAEASAGPRPGGASRDPLAGQEEERILLEQLGRALKTISSTALSASIQSGSVGMILALPARQLEDPTLHRLTDALGREPDSVSAEWTVGVGHPRGSLLEAAAGVDGAAHVAETSATLRGVRKPFYRATDVRLRGLLALLRNDPRVQQFVESELEALLQAEAQGRGGHLELLARYLESGGNKAAMARSGYFSRPTLYARLARLEELLGVDLDDAESRTSLHVALLLHRLRAL
ncbi:PucR family transcriptional regulator [Pseudarthrobacter sp. NPDC092419]|uniref:PucR family transcriptional regulator n=1 Tax=Pseudarthrobacter sp. NPDC092419 TaxID=3364414 RepID=UPI00382A4C4B